MPFPRAPCSGCRRTPDGACRGGSPSCARRSSARARRSRTGAGGARGASASPSICLQREDMLGAASVTPKPSRSQRRVMALAYNHEEITPRELKPALFELDGISRETVEAHYKLYQGYVNKRNEILGKLDGADLGSANQVYSEFRALKVDLTFAIGGIKNHEIYFEHLGGHGGDPRGIFCDPVKRGVGSAAPWEAGPQATRMGGRRGGWAAADRDAGP